MKSIYLNFTNPNVSYNSIHQWTRDTNEHLNSIFGKDAILEFDKVWHDIAGSHSVTYAPYGDWNNTAKQAVAEFVGQEIDLVNFQSEFISHPVICRVFDHLKTQGWLVEFKNEIYR